MYEYTSKWLSVTYFFMSIFQWNIAQARPMSVSDVSPSLQSWFSTTHRSYSQPTLPPRGVTDLYLSWGIHIEHARTVYHETCGTEYQRPHRRCNSQTPYFTNVMEHSTSAPNERVLRTTQLAKLSFNHPSVVLTADFCQYFNKVF